MFHDYECFVIAIRNLLFLDSYISFFFLNSLSYLTFLYSCFFKIFCVKHQTEYLTLFSYNSFFSLFLLFFLYSLATSFIFVVFSCNIFHFYPIIFPIRLYLSFLFLDSLLYLISIRSSMFIYKSTFRAAGSILPPIAQVSSGLVQMRAKQTYVKLCQSLVGRTTTSG